ncbi:MAG: hypothetical protein V4484_09935 [Pseudomonadota bacterium]
MYIPLSKKLGQDVKIVHVAYSAHEEAMLRAAGISAGIINFKHELALQLARASALDHALLEHIDSLFIAHTAGRFTLNGSLQSDRGFSLLNGDEALLLSQAYYAVWDAIFAEHAVNLVMHEPVSLHLNHMCSMVCAKYGALYLYPVMAMNPSGQLSYLIASGDNFGCPEIQQAYAHFLATPDAIDVARCEQFLTQFRSSFKIFLGDAIKPKNATVRLLLRSLKRRVSRWRRLPQLDRLKDNIDYWDLQQDPAMARLRNLRQYRRRLTYDRFDPSRPYYYYSMHMEPEAVVLYLAAGVYTTQVKLIENIAAQLPVGAVLYVKDHPHVSGYRDVADYLRLQAIPNVRVVDPGIAGKLIMKDAVGVFTINGTAGLEALLLGKQVYAFGNTFYGVCPRVHYLHHVRDLRAVLYANRDQRYADDADLLPFVMAYLTAMHAGLVDYFSGRAPTYGIDLDQNIARIASDLVAFSQAHG